MLRESVDYIFLEGVGLDTKMLKRWVIKNVPSNVVKATAEVRRDWLLYVHIHIDAQHRD
jgi:hypothetical protein